MTGTPCEAVVRQHRLIHYPDRVLELFPKGSDLHRIGVVSYLGVPLLDADGTIMGHLAVIDRQPMPPEPRMLAVFQIFAARAAAELRRLRAERALREREEKLARLVTFAMDAIVELDHALRVTQANPAAESVFGATQESLLQRDFCTRLRPDSRDELTRRVAELDARPPGTRASWFANALSLVRENGETFVAEATLSRGGGARPDLLHADPARRERAARGRAQHRAAVGRGREPARRDRRGRARGRDPRRQRSRCGRPWPTPSSWPLPTRPC